MLKYPKNIWIITLTTALASTVPPFFILVGGLMGAELAPKTEWATLPIALMVLGIVGAMIPSVYIMKCWGRKCGSILGLCIYIVSALICSQASYQNSFSLLLTGAVFLGAGTAFIQQFRFAVIESLDDPQDIPGALSLLLLSGAVAAVIGPEIAVRGRYLLGEEESYVGSFLLLVLVNILALFIFSLFENPPPPKATIKQVQRPVLEIIRQPIFLTAVASAGVGFAVMSFLMTSTPVTMHHFHGHSIEDAKWVIQSHMLAMFLPSLVTGKLIQHFGVSVILLVGASLFAVVLLIAMQGHELMHFWWALVLLGVGWNFLFIGGTTLLPQSYSHDERFKAQAVNDVVVFSMQALAALSAGWVLFRYGWDVQLMICVPLVVIAFVLAGIAFKRENPLKKRVKQKQK